MKQRKASGGYLSAHGLTAYNLLEYLTQGGTDHAVIRKLAEDDLDFIRARRDCADFRVGYYVRILYSFYSVIPEDMYEEIKKVLLDFPYDDCGGHSMCTWTENHRLYIDGSEYLLATRFPDAVFGDGHNGRRHMVNALIKLNEWFAHEDMFGMSEWESNNYYPETMAALSNILQFAPEGGVRAEAENVMDKMIYDIMSQTVYNGGYIFSPAASRAYVDNKISSREGNYLEKQIRMILGEEITDLKEKEACFALLLRAKREDGTPVYVPDIGRARRSFMGDHACSGAEDDPESMERDRAADGGILPRTFRELLELPGRESIITQGVDLKDYKKQGLLDYSYKNVRYALMSGAVSDYRVIGNSMMYFCETGMIDNGMLKALKPFARPILYRTGLLSLIKRFVQVPWDGSAMESAKIYTYTDQRYSVSAAVGYRVGRILFQQNSLSVALSHDISLFTTAPYKTSEKTGSPDYWIGSSVAPLTVAHRNVALQIYDMRHAKPGVSHLFFPTGLFDELDLSRISDGILLGRSSGVNIAVFTNPGVHFRPAAESREKDLSLYQDKKVPEGIYDKEYDLINTAAGYHYYVFEADRQQTFADFGLSFRESSGGGFAADGERNSMLQGTSPVTHAELSRAQMQGGNLFYRGRDHRYRLDYSTKRVYFTVDGEKVSY